MKRFITYLYEYENGKKMKNVGFIRVDIRGEFVNVELCIKNYMHRDTDGTLYALIQEENIQAVEWAKIRLQGGQCVRKIVLEEQTFRDRNYTLKDILGVVILFEDKGYLASCWKDEYADEIARWEISSDKETSNTVEEDPETENLIQAAEEMKKVEYMPPKSDVTYKKIQFEQIRELPSSNWHLSENAFLKHGLYNYGFLFLKKEMGEDGVRMWLGVPGYYEKQELLMAMLFGFPEFEPVLKEVVDMEMYKEESFPNIEKNQEPKTGIFGGWFVLLDK